MRNDVIIISVTISCIATLPYVIGVIGGEQKPRVATWLVWAVLAAIGSGSAFLGHQIPAGVFTLVTALEYATVAILGFRLGSRKFTMLDIGCLLAAFLGLLLLIVTKSPTAAIIIVIIADAVGTTPTIVHSWRRPYEESYLVFLLYVIAEVMILAVANFKVFTSFAYPVFYLIEDVTILGLILFSTHRQRDRVIDQMSADRRAGKVGASTAGAATPVVVDFIEPSPVTVENSSQHSLTTNVAAQTDETLPTITYQLSGQPNESGWHKSPITITFVGADTKMGIASCSPPVTLNMDGANQEVTGVAKNFAGKLASVTVVLNIDQTPPNLGEPQWEAPSAVNPKWTLRVPASDRTSGVARAECVGEPLPAIDRSAPIAYVNGMLIIPLSDNLAVGSYTLRVRVVDVAGNWSDPKTITWSVAPGSGLVHS